jgi:glyoxylase-like metal-dependent hydrolase (beta-lactamase superfamily II)
MEIHSIQAGFGVAHLIESAAGLYLVDAGSPRSERKILKVMKELGRDDLSLIFLTHAHFDHFGCAAALRSLTGAPIAIHKLDAGSLAKAETPLGIVRGRGKIAQAFLPLAEMIYKPVPTQADIQFEDGYDFKNLGLEAEAIHLPGHTPGSSGLITEGNLAFVGDLLSTTSKPHVQRYYATDWSQVSKSLDRLKALNPEWVYTGHGTIPLSRQGLHKLEAQSY